MLEKILRLYYMAIEGDVRSPLVHLFGPPGCGKSSSVEQAADLLGVRMHTINLSRVSPLELEGVQMPQGIAEEMQLKLLHATFWTQLNEGDILLFDEFLRAFPEVMNGLLDIITAREVGGLRLPKVFFIAASNSTIAYDKALEDRLLHLPVTDPRKSANERKRLATMIVEAIGLMPQMAQSDEMEALLYNQVLPMFEVLDHLKKRNAPTSYEGHSVRNLIGQAQLRHVECKELRELIEVNNITVAAQGKWQYMFVIDPRAVPKGYAEKAETLIGNPKLTDKQRLNTRLNLELIQLEAIRHEEV